MRSAWSPWEKLDPQLKREYSGTAKGKGAVYAWKGNDNVGAGRMEITDAKPNEKVTIALDFTAPFKAHNTTEFILEPGGEATTVTWKMAGENQFIGKLMSLFMDMDQMVGKDFEAGLSHMKAAAEH